MARKSRDELSPAYRARIERAEARGLTRQQARGHSESREYHRRAVRERREHGITGDQLRTVARYAERRAAKNKALNPGDLVDWAKAHGYQQFKAFKAERESLRRGYKADRKSGTYKPRDLAEFKATVQAPPKHGGGGGGGYSGGGGGGGGGGGDFGGDDGDHYDDYSDDTDFDEDFDEDYYEDLEDFDFEDMGVEWMFYHDD